MSRKKHSGISRLLHSFLLLPLMGLPDSTLPGKGISRKRKRFRKLEKEVEESEISTVPTSSSKKRPKRKWKYSRTQEWDDD